jgi:hypothetical protein
MGKILLDLVPLFVALLTLVIVYLERYDKFYLMFFRHTKLNFSGTWVGLSIFLPSPYQRITDDEHFFNLSIEIKHRGSHLRMQQVIVDITTFSGEKVRMAGSRKFLGNGRVIRDSNVLVQFDEENGLTCGVMYLVSNTWGTRLEGIVTARSVEGEPALAKVVLLREHEKGELDRIRAEHSKKKAILS